MVFAVILSLTNTGIIDIFKILFKLCLRPDLRFWYLFYLLFLISVYVNYFIRNGIPSIIFYEIISVF